MSGTKKVEVYSEKLARMIEVDVVNTRESMNEDDVTVMLVVDEEE